MKRTTAERFWAKVDKNRPEGCWLWTAYTNDGGYGHFWDGARMVYAHRFAFERAYGPIPAGLQVDHVRSRGCRHRNCVNVAHLELVTTQENSRRGIAGEVNGARQRAKTHCPAGHGYTAENTYVDRRGKRYCKTCQRERNREARARKRATHEV